MGATLKDLATVHSRKMPEQVDNLTEEAPILAVIPFEEASHGLWNMYEDVSDVDGAGWVEMNAPLPAVDVTSDLKKVDLSILGGEIECPEDTANMFGGTTNYFAKKLPKVIRKSGMAAEQRILYDNFRTWALDKGKAVNAGAATDDCYSMLAVRFISGETTGLYSKESFKQGSLLDVTPINSGSIYKAASGKHQGVLCFGMRLKAYFGIQIANRHSVAAIVNINKSNLPTAMMIDDLLADVRAIPGNTFLFMHEKAKTLLYEHKGKSLQVNVGGKDMDRQVTHWNGVEIVTSYNFLDAAEKAVAF
ncbi:hypothetical protein N1030_17550 [Desulfovibrio mangrovi]|uniref:major capsid protein n=1 Tax=Desulfovibrio mangrovi TaxID=2976983 RepID=UPI0022469F29|nr:hypothetical protein [Desulfovibrio mangrovi]UZP67378.1 hypothetical protein N1030_17550 [Desulfovibrio mangrovi]